MADSALSLTINGEPERAAGLSPATTLLQFLRSRGWTSVKEGCAEGDCGACTVALVVGGADGTARYQAVVSCLVLLPQVDGLEVWTAEGLAAADGLHPVQAQLVAHGGSQCGYCTPGFVMSLFADLYRPGRQGFDDETLVGNLCRCTGYLPIRAAARALASPPADDPFLRRLRTPAPTARRLAYAADGECFLRPTTLADVLALLRDHPAAQVVAGATDLGLEVTKRFRRFPLLVALDGVPELQVIRTDPDAIEIGAAVTLARLEEELAGILPPLDAMLRLFASRQIRSRATIGGNLVTASPIGDLAPVLLALDAEARIAGPAGTRALPLAAFFTEYRRTALGPGDLLVAVRVPRHPAPGAVSRLAHAYKVGKSRRADISTVAAAFALHLDAAGHVARARLAYGGVAPTPVRARGAEAALEGRVFDAAALAAGRRALAGEFEPISDLRGSAAYRRRLVENLLERFYEDIRAEGRG